MTDYLANAASSIISGKISGSASGIHDREFPADTIQGLLVPGLDASGAVPAPDPEGIEELENSYKAARDPGPPSLFFELIHYKPVVIELGNIVTTVLREIEIYNAYRQEVRELSSAAANAGPGVTLVGLPTLPDAVPAQSNMLFDVQVTTQGPARIDGTLDFVSDVASFSIIITGDRVILFPHAPERGIEETLEWKTDILKSANGGEQRVSVRKNPRQFFNMLLRIEEGKELRDMLTLLKGWHPGVFGMPIWWEARELGADAAVDDTVVTVDTTAGDFREEGLAILWNNEEQYEALQIDTLTANSITFTSPLSIDFVAGETLVMPVRMAHLSATISGSRYHKNLMDVQLSIRVLDNDADLADTGAFSEHNSKVLLDDANMVSGTLPDDLTREILSIDNATSVPTQFSDWLASHPITSKAFVADSLEEVWAIRQLLHALRGSQVSFYLPTFYKDLNVVENLTATSSYMDIENQGYCDFIQAQEPFKSVWIELTDGTILTRQITDYIEISDTVERLTVDTPWASTVTPEEIERVSFCRLVRIIDDKATFVHDGPGDAKVSVDVTGVQT